MHWYSEHCAAKTVLSTAKMLKLLDLLNWILTASASALTADPRLVATGRAAGATSAKGTSYLPRGVQGRKVPRECVRWGLRKAASATIASGVCWAQSSKKKERRRFCVSGPS